MAITKPPVSGAPSGASDSPGTPETTAPRLRRWVFCWPAAVIVLGFVAFTLIAPETAESLVMGLQEGIVRNFSWYYGSSRRSSSASRSSSGSAASVTSSSAKTETSPSSAPPRGSRCSSRQAWASASSSTAWRSRSATSLTAPGCHRDGGRARPAGHGADLPALGPARLGDLRRARPRARLRDPPSGPPGVDPLGAGAAARPPGQGRLGNGSTSSPWSEPCSVSRRRSASGSSRSVRASGAPASPKQHGQPDRHHPRHHGRHHRLARDRGHQGHEDPVELQPAAGRRAVALRADRRADAVLVARLGAVDRRVPAERRRAVVQRDGAAGCRGRGLAGRLDHVLLGWWMSWAPFVGIFIARISKGRTVRQFVFGVLLVPTALTFLWFAVLGGTAIYRQTDGAGGLVGTAARWTSRARCSRCSATSGRCGADVRSHLADRHLLRHLVRLGFARHGDDRVGRRHRAEELAAGVLRPGLGAARHRTAHRGRSRRVEDGRHHHRVAVRVVLLLVCWSTIIAFTRERRAYDKAERAILLEHVGEYYGLEVDAPTEGGLRGGLARPWEAVRRRVQRARPGGVAPGAASAGTGAGAGGVPTRVLLAVPARRRRLVLVLVLVLVPVPGRLRLALGGCLGRSRRPLAADRRRLGRSRDGPQPRPGAAGVSRRLTGARAPRSDQRTTF